MVQQVPLDDHPLPDLMGPSMTLLLLLTDGPYMINRIITFAWEQISKVQIMVLRQQYKSLLGKEAAAFSPPNSKIRTINKRRSGECKDGKI